MSKPVELIRPPQQRRSQESLERVLAAGAEVLREVGYEGFTVQEVSRRAKVSVGSIYARTPGKDSLFLAIYERETQRMAEEQQQIQVTSRREGLTGRELVVALVEELAHFVLRNADTLRVFMHRAAVDRDAWHRGSEGLRQVAHTFEQALLEHRGELTHPNPELAIDVAFHFVYSTLARRVSHGPGFGSDREISEDELVRELAAAAADYLLAPRAPAPARRRRARRAA